mgnify:CR=1 FL=1
MGFYYTPYWIALLGMRDLVHGPSKTILRQLCTGNTEGGNVGGCSTIRGPWLLVPVHELRQDGPVTPSQVSCSEMQVFCHWTGLQNGPVRLKWFFSDSTSFAIASNSLQLCSWNIHCLYYD